MKNRTDEKDWAKKGPRRTERKIGRHQTIEFFNLIINLFSSLINITSRVCLFISWWSTSMRIVPTFYDWQLLHFNSKTCSICNLESLILHFVLSMTKSWKLLNGSLRCNVHHHSFGTLAKECVFNSCVRLMISVLLFAYLLL